MSRAPRLEIVVGQPAAHSFARQAVVISELNHRVGQQRQRPAFATGGRPGACRRHQQGLFLAGQLAFRARTRLLAQDPRQIAFLEAALGPADRLTRTARTISASQLPASAASKICARLSLRAACSSRRASPPVRPSRFGSIPRDTVHHASPPCRRPGTNPAMSQKSGARLTERQGHYLAFIHTYSYMFGQPPAEADIQRHFPCQPTVGPPDDRHPRAEWFHSPSAPALPEASRFSCHPKTSLSSNGSVSKHQNHCDEPLGDYNSKLPAEHDLVRFDM